MATTSNEALAWFKQSRIDLNAARSLHDSGYYSTAVFHCQQAVEFALKGLWVLKLRTEPPYTHTLGRLGDKVGASARFENLFDTLTIAYLDSRYPGSAVNDMDRIYGEELSAISLRETEEVLQWIQSERELISQDLSTS